MALLHQHWPTMLCVAVITVLLYLQIPFAAGGCIWYGQCTYGPHGARNCPYSGPAKNLTDENAQDILASVCPMLYNPATDITPPATCCNGGQLDALNHNLTMLRQLFSRCPSCLNNVVSMYCYFTCSPFQDSFMAVESLDSDAAPNGTKQTYISAVNVALSKEFTHGMYNSCRDVQNPSSNTKAIELACGHDSAHCTPQNWLDYMGDVTNESPFQINFKLSQTPVTFKNVTLYPMNVTADPCSTTCSCQDCKAVCKDRPKPPPEEHWTIIGIDGVYFIAASTFLVFFLIFGISEAWRLLYCSKPAEPQSVAVPSGLNGDPADPYDKVVTRNDVSCCQRWGASMERKFHRLFYWWGHFCARHSIFVILVGVVACAVMTAGVSMFKVTTDPVELWSSPDSRARQEKNYFDEHFTPFYRTEQVIITPKKNSSQWCYRHMESDPCQWFGPMLKSEILQEVYNLQTRLANLVAYDEEANHTVTLKDICFQPLQPDITECTINSVINYFQNNETLLNLQYGDDFATYYSNVEHIQFCVGDPTAPVDINQYLETVAHVDIPCLAAYGGPVMPWVAFGGYNESEYMNATALIVTFTNNNFKNDTFQKMARTWEAEFIRTLKAYESDNITISFTSERSVEDEIERESRSDVKTIVISYLVMFFYVSIMLGQYHSCRSLLINSKMILGLAGVLIVLLSVSSSIGIYSFAGIPGTLIIFEVVPFLVLAVGVDNIFILVQAYQRDYSPNASVEDQVAAAVSKVGPSMMLTSISEALAFFLGATTDMPAVKVFSLYAALAVLLDFFLQISCFVSLLALDARREQARRPECCCCVKLGDDRTQSDTEGVLHKIFRKYYSPVLLSDYVRPVVVIGFVAWTCLAVAFGSRVEIGLDQKLSMPEDSFVLDYFNNMSEYLSVGAPVYFVVEKGHNYTNIQGQNKICGSQGCPEESLLGNIFSASEDPQRSFIAHPASSWLDDYFDWLAPVGASACCRKYKDTGEFCRATEKDRNKCTKSCPLNNTLEGRPVGHTFLRYLPWFLQDNPSAAGCAKGGHAAYGSGVELFYNESQSELEIGATYFMTYHTALKTSKDYIKALSYARDLTDSITHEINHWPGDNNSHHGLSNMTDSYQFEKVFAYSVWYVFYEQYLYVTDMAMSGLGISLGAVFIVTFILLGFDLWSAVIILVTISMIVASMMGFMQLWDITLNAISLVNLIMTIGISVEFCSHITRAFAVSIKRTRLDRAKDALTHMGSSVLSGITLTKLGGIIVLAFSKSQLFQVFYFRMYLGMVIFGASFGLVFLPVLLSYVGPSINKAKVLAHQDNQRRNAEDHDGIHPDYPPPAYSDRNPILSDVDPPAYSEAYASNPNTDRPIL